MTSLLLGRVTSYNTAAKDMTKHNKVCTHKNEVTNQ